MREGTREFYEENPPEDWEDCGGCDCYHPPGFTGDCREDASRWPDPKAIDRIMADAEDRARLIAAAPALLAALLDMLDCLETEIECGDAFPYTAKIERAWESVRQARGEEAS